MMRVLFLYPRTLDESHLVGGVIEFFYALFPKFKSFGIEPFIYAADKTSTMITQSSSVIPDATIYNGPYVKPGWWISQRRLMPALKLCHDAKIDVIHAQGTYTAGFMAWQMHRRSGIPYVVTSHSDILAVNSKRMARQRVRVRCQQVLKHATFVTHLTPMMAKVSHDLWDTKEKSMTIGNGIDCQDWQSFLSLPEKNYMLGIGRLERGKGFHLLIEMYARLREQGITTSLVIAGSGSEEKNLHSQVRHLGLQLVTELNDLSAIPEKSVVFVGYVRNELKKKLIAQSQFLLFPTQPDLWEEAFGIVQLEAMAAGKAIIASETNVTRFLQEAGLHAVNVAPKDVAEWAKQTKILLENENLRKKLGEMNLEAVASFDWQPIAKQYYEVYERSISHDAVTKRR